MDRGFVAIRKIPLLGIKMMDETKDDAGHDSPAHNHTNMMLMTLGRASHLESTNSPI